MNDVTRILNVVSRSDARAANEMLSLVYEELRRLAAAKMALEASGQTLQATALVHEAWLRLTSDQKRQWNDRTHFFAAAAEAMRLILVDNARRKRAQRHGGSLRRVAMPEIACAVEENADQILAVNEALKKLAAHDQPKAEVLKLPYLVGLTPEEAAEVLGFSVATANAIGPTPAPGWRRKSVRTNGKPRNTPNARKRLRAVLLPRVWHIPRFRLA